MKKKSSSDINGISSKLLQHVAHQISLPICHIYNLSVSTGVFPEQWKISKVVPIYKKAGSKQDMENYRGISIVNAFSKIIEQIVANQLVSHLNRNSFFYEHQYGFLKGRSTTQAILQVVNLVSDNINRSKVSLAIFLDIKKCFDSVDHSILLSKLENAGIRGIPLKWFKSFLSGRKQKLKLGNIVSQNICDIDI